jgi:hypothetical protein
VEHFQEYQTLWNGDNGYLFFYRCEIPYDVPSNEAWSSGKARGWAGYKVADSVKKHSATALGVYSYFRDAPIVMDNSIEASKSPGVQFKNIVSFWLTGKEGSSVEHVINGVGSVSNKTAREVRVTEYPPKS